MNLTHQILHPITDRTAGRVDPRAILGILANRKSLLSLSVFKTKSSSL